jgi:hypothetical protein
MADDPEQEGVEFSTFTTPVGVSNGHDETPSIEDQAKLETLAIFARREMLTVDGRVDQWKVADEIEPTIVQALVKVEKDRTRVGVTPTRLMEVHFPEVPKRSEIESEDEDVLAVADKTYGNVKDAVFRVLNIMPDAPIQSRLANNGDGLVLCRLPKSRGAEERAYVTRNKQCINKDNNLPAYKAVQAAEKKAAALTGMSIERVSEHGKWFRSQYKSAMKEGLDAANNTVQLALDMGDDAQDSDE